MNHFQHLEPRYRQLRDWVSGEYSEMRTELHYAEKSAAEYGATQNDLIASAIAGASSMQLRSMDSRATLSRMALEEAHEREIGYFGATERKFLLAILTGRYDFAIKDGLSPGFSSDEQHNEDIKQAAAIRRLALGSK